uniref:Arginine kinase n=1 Tax=Glossina brevipalpis TaxID=37001 RepID=A0A1A9WYG8_9MUSC
MPPKRRRRFQGIYYHSSPPKVLSMNGHMSNGHNRGRKRDVDVKLSTIRIWMHEKDIGKLARILWAGQGNRLRQQASTNSKVKRFLSAVPYVMNSIKDVHQSVIDNSLENLQTHLEPPVPPALVTCRDANGLNLIHKAAGLGHATILEYLIATWPDGVHETDVTGKTPLHFAASAKNNMRCYTLLTQAGCDEEALDYKMKTPTYYRHKPNEIERAFLTYVPEAPRVSPGVATDWEALNPDSNDGKKRDIKIPELNGFGRHSNAESNENTSEAELTEGVHQIAENNSSEKAESHTKEETTEIIDEPKAEDESSNGNAENPEASSEKEESATEETNDPDEENEKNEEEQQQKSEKQFEIINDCITGTVTKDAADNESVVMPETDENEEINDDIANETEILTSDKATVSTSEETVEHNTNIEKEEEEIGEGKEDDEQEDKEEDKEDIKEDEEEEEKEEEKEEEEEKEKEKEVEKKEEKEEEQEEDKENDREEEQEEEKEEKKEEEKEDEKEEDKEEEEEGEENEDVNVDTELEKKNEDSSGEVDADEHETNRRNENIEDDECVNEDEPKSSGNNQEIVVDAEYEDNENQKTEEDENNNMKDKETSEEESQNASQDEEQKIKENEEGTDVKKCVKEIESKDFVEDLEPEAKSSVKNKSDNSDVEELEESDIDAEDDSKEVVIVNTESNSPQQTKAEINEKNYENPFNMTNNESESDDDEETNNNNNNNDDDKENAKELTGNNNSSDEETELNDHNNNNYDDANQHGKMLNENREENATEEEENAEKRASEQEEEKEEDEEKQDGKEEMAEEEKEGVTKEDLVVEENATALEETNEEETVEPEDKMEPHNSIHESEERDSPITPSLAIEGFVAGASEDNTVQSQTAAFDHNEKELQQIVAAGDMEKLAQIVLNGDGEKLSNVKAKVPEVQAFLDNVPNYMSKIQRVHKAARNGSLLSLQQALDRRKFAISRDNISPNGATPLHVAALFGHSDILRYLASRFPETTSATDFDGRTPLHYAAVINDNGHFYNVLMKLGANPKLADKLGNTAEQYHSDDNMRNILNYRQLLKTFNAEELESQLLSDQVPDDLHSSRRSLDDDDISQILDRCFDVIHNSRKVWSGSNASALSQKKPLSGASSVQLAITSYLSRFLRPSIYEKIKRRQTRLDHNLFDVIWPALRKKSKQRLLEEDINCGVIAPDFDVYVVFQEFMVPLIKDMQCMSVTSDFKPHPRIAYFPVENGERLNTAGFVFNDETNLVIRCTVECSRNLDNYELPLNLTVGQVEQVERYIMSKLFNEEFVKVTQEPEQGNYYTLSEVLEENSDVYKMLDEYGLVIPFPDTRDVVQEAESKVFNGQLWPYGRGVYVSASNHLALWLNCQEHLRVIATSTKKNSTDMGSVYTRVGRTITYLEQRLHFKESFLLGYLQTRPSYLGTGLKITTTLRLPNLIREMDNLRHLCAVRGLHLTTSNNDKTINVCLVNMRSMGFMEYEIFQDYCTAVTNILALEKDMSLNNSKHVASVLTNIWLPTFTGQVENQSFENNPLFKTEQGKYLADTLAEPLIKALTQIANKRPADPLLYLTNYLQSFVKARNTNGKTITTTQAAVHTGSAVSNIAQNELSIEKQNGNVIVNGIDGDAGADHLIEDLDESELDDTKKMEERDEHGQSRLHFACARSNRKGALINLIEESSVDISYRDELYRTARDVSLQANQLGNAKEIDRYVFSLAVVGDVKPFEYLAISGYDHIIDISDDNDASIIDVAEQRGNTEVATFLRALRSMEELREELHQMIRDNRVERVKEIVDTPNGKWFIKAKNYYGIVISFNKPIRNSWETILKESVEIVEYFVNMCPESLKIGDNLERSPLHYAMGTTTIESISRILIQNGAKRTSKDLKGRQPSYYFMNKADILRLQEEEDENR